MKLPRKGDKKLAFGGGSQQGDHVHLIIEYGPKDNDILELDMSWEEAENLHENLSALLGKDEENDVK